MICISRDGIDGSSPWSWHDIHVGGATAYLAQDLVRELTASQMRDLEVLIVQAARLSRDREDAERLARACDETGGAP